MTVRSSRRTHVDISPGKRSACSIARSAAAPQRPATDHVVIRKVDHNGSVSFAGGDYRAGNAFKGRQVEVCLAGDTVQIWRRETPAHPRGQA